MNKISKVNEKGSNYIPFNARKNTNFLKIKKLKEKKLTSFLSIIDFSLSIGSPSTTLYHNSHNVLFAAKEANKFICKVILAHFKDLKKRKKKKI